MTNFIPKILILILFHKNSWSDISVDGYELPVTDSGYDLIDIGRDTSYSVGVPDYKSDGQLGFHNNTDKVTLMDRETVLRTMFLPKNKDDDSSVWNKYTNYDRPQADTAPTYSSTNSFGHHSDEFDFYPPLERTEDSEEESLESLCETPTSIRKIQRMNKTKTSENGKTYVITKIVKSRKCKRRTPKQKEVQRRTFNIIPNLSSIIPIPWMTKKSDDSANEFGGKSFKSAGASPNFQGQEKIQTDDQGLDHDPPPKPSPPSSYYNFDKYKKVLNLFTIVKFDNGDCYANGIKGTCLHQIECQAKGGKPIGTCAKGFGICCYVERSCGGRTRENCTYFVNDGFPKPSANAPQVCTLTIEKAHPEVQQLRLEFMIFELRGPTNGTCISDRFTITGHNTNHIVPDICGINSEQHVYVDVDQSNGPYNLNVVTMGGHFPRTFQIKITQIKNNDEILAPKNCLQYYMETTGVVQTLNYQYSDLGNLPEAAPGYFNNMNYAICLKKNLGFCSVTYENEDRDTGSNEPTFQMLNTDLDGRILLPPGQGGAEVFDCPDDYIIVNGVRLCGERLNDATIDADYTKNYPVTDFSNGPFILQVRTNSAVSGRGFYLKYRQNPCLQ